MIFIKDPLEIQKMREGGKILVRILKSLEKEVKIGMNTFELEDKARKLIVENKAQPAFLNYRGYPAALCVSINEEIVHGIPSKNKIIKDGDIVSIDLGVLYKGLITDASLTVGVGKVTSKEKKLIEVTRKALDKAISKAKIGNQIKDISKVIQETVEKAGFQVIRDCVGHGVGKRVHEDPLVPNSVHKGKSEILKEGMTIAIEPIATIGDFKTIVEVNGWTVITRDRSQTAHFEQTIAVGKNGGEILTPF
ncbi:type I methionyl aminopeptidase [Patescibacteria group bacterium]